VRADKHLHLKFLIRYWKIMTKCFAGLLLPLLKEVNIPKFM